MDSKKCIKCGETKCADMFRHGRRKCKKCEYELFCEWRSENKDKIKKQSDRYSLKHKQDIKERRIKRYLENSEEIKKKVKEYRDRNPDAVRKSTRKHYDNNKDKILEYHKKYRQENSERIARNKLIYEANRSEKDHSFKLRRVVRNSVYCAILRSGSRKEGSILKNLPYSMDELKSHIENLFEPWMSWDNWGIYDPDIWDDDNPLTWTWHLDHVIRQADLPYDSFDHPNFQKCWALSNLRPYSSKMNVIENNRRITCDV